MKLLLFAHQQRRIGGVERFNLNFCKRMSRLYDVIFLYDEADKDALEEMEQYAECIQYVGQKIDVDVCVYSSSWGTRPEKDIIAKKYIQVVHADYKWCRDNMSFVYEKRPKVSLHVCVGKYVEKVFRGMYKYPTVQIYNLLDDKVKAEKVLKLISVTRIGKEKGLERMVKMAKMLHDKGKKFYWHIYGDGADAVYFRKIREQLKDIKEVVFMGASFDLASYLKDADYLVALSDTEGFSYSIYEALQMETPCIVTDFPSAYEQVEDGVNGYIVKMDLSDLDIEKIYKKIPKFKFKEKSSEEDWVKIIGTPGKSKRKTKVKQVLPKIITMIVKKRYHDMILNRVVLPTEIIECTRSRADLLIKMGLAEEIKNI